MTDRPINLRAWEVRAFNEGRKTRVTRVLKPQPPEWTAGVIDIKKPTFDEDEGGWGQWQTEWSPETFEKRGEPLREFWVTLRGLRYAVGDLLWAREALDMGFKGGFPICTCTYAADGRPVDLRPSPYWAGDQKRNSVSPIVMPRWASRLTLTVEAVKVCRVQDITEGEAIAEGVGTGDPLHAFHEQYNADHDPGALDRNDWVASYTVRIERQNIDKETTND